MLEVDSRSAQIGDDTAQDDPAEVKSGMAELKRSLAELKRGLAELKRGLAEVKRGVAEVKKCRGSCPASAICAVTIWHVHVACSCLHVLDLSWNSSAGVSFSFFAKSP